MNRLHCNYPTDPIWTRAQWKWVQTMRYNVHGTLHTAWYKAGWGPGYSDGYWHKFYINPAFRVSWENYWQTEQWASIDDDDNLTG